jgi:hypothetical protein
VSEFSESFHLRRGSQRDAVALLERADARGFVFEAKNGWVAFVCGAVAGDVNVAERPDLPRSVAEWLGRRQATEATQARVIRANTGTLVHYSFAPDHGCRIDRYDGPNLAGRIEVSFDDDSVRFDEAAFVRDGLLDTTAASEVEQWLARAATYHARTTALLEAQLAAPEPEQPDLHARYLAERYFLARALGLAEYEWLSFDSQCESPAERCMPVSIPGR